MKTALMTNLFKNRCNWRNVVAIAICLAGFTVFSGCKKDDNSSDPNNPNDDGLENLGYIAPERDADPHIFVNMEDGSSLAFYTHAETGNVKSAIYDDDNKTVLIRYGVDGLPLGAYSENQYYLFLYSGNTATTEIYNADTDQKIDEQSVQSEDIAELIKDSPYLRSAPFTPICVTKQFAAKAKATNLVLDSMNPLNNIKCKVLLDRITNTVVGSCLDDYLQQKFRDNLKGFKAASFTNKINGKLEGYMKDDRVKRLFEEIEKRNPYDWSNFDLIDQCSCVNPPLDEGSGGSEDPLEVDLTNTKWEMDYWYWWDIIDFKSNKSCSATTRNNTIIGTGTWQKTSNTVTFSISYTDNEMYFDFAFQATITGSTMSGHVTITTTLEGDKEVNSGAFSAHKITSTRSLNSM